MSRSLMARLSSCLPVCGNLDRKVLELLSKQVRQDICAHLTSEPEALDVACARDPERRLPLDWRREDFDVNRFPVSVGAGDRLALPEASDGIDAARHHRASVTIIFGLQREVVHVPAGGKRKADSTPRDVVDDSPFLCDSNRIVQRHDDAAGPDLDVRRDGGDRGARDSWIWIESPERMKVALRCPYCSEAVRVCVARTLEQESILVLARGSCHCSEIKQAEVHPAS